MPLFLIIFGQTTELCSSFGYVRSTTDCCGLTLWWKGGTDARGMTSWERRLAFLVPSDAGDSSLFKENSADTATSTRFFCHGIHQWRASRAGFCLNTRGIGIYKKGEIVPKSKPQFRSSTVSIKSKITPCLWFDTQAEDAAKWYTSIFPSSTIKHIARGKEPGSVMFIAFTLNNQPFSAMNGSSQSPFTMAVSFQIDCEDQAEVDHYWYNLAEGGMESRCGWVKDKFGLSWQVLPRQLSEFMSSGDPEKTKRVSEAMFKMNKLEVEGLRKAFEGN